MNEPSEFIHDEYPSRNGCSITFWLALVVFVATLVILL